MVTKNGKFFQSEIRNVFPSSISLIWYFLNFICFSFFFSFSSGGVFPKSKFQHSHSALMYFLHESSTNCRQHVLMEDLMMSRIMSLLLCHSHAKFKFDCSAISERSFDFIIQFILVFIFFWIAFMITIYSWGPIYSFWLLPKWTVVCSAFVFKHFFFQFYRISWNWERYFIFTFFSFLIRLSLQFEISFYFMFFPFFIETYRKFYMSSNQEHTI